MSTSPEHNSQAPTAQRRFRGLAPEERQSQRRAQLMEAGLEVFGARGFHGAGVRDICAQAKLTERYFYESFQNREALFLAVYQEATRRIEARMLEALATVPLSTPSEATRAGLRAVLELFRQDPRIARVTLLEVLTLGTVDTAFEVSASFAQIIEQLTLAQYPGLGAHGWNARMLATGLYGSTIHIAQRWTLDGFKEPLEQVLEHCALFYEAAAVKMDALPAPAARLREPRPTHDKRARPVKQARKATRSKR